MIIYEVYNLPGQVEMWDTFYKQLFVYILHVFYKQILCIVLMMCIFCRQEFMYAKYIQDVYLQNGSHISTNFSINYEISIKICEGGTMVKN